MSISPRIMATRNKLRKWNCFKCADTLRSDEHCQVPCGCGLTIHRKCMAKWQLRELPQGVSCPVCSALWDNPVNSTYQRFEDIKNGIWPPKREPTEPVPPDCFPDGFDDDLTNDVTTSKYGDILISPEDFVLHSRDRTGSVGIHEQVAAAEHLLDVAEGFEKVQTDLEKINYAITRILQAYKLFRLWNYGAEWSWPVLKATLDSLDGASDAKSRLESAEHDVRRENKYIDYYLFEINEIREATARCRARLLLCDEQENQAVQSPDTMMKAVEQGTKRICEFEAIIAKFKPDLVLAEAKKAEASDLIAAKLARVKAILPDCRLALAEIIAGLSKYLD